MNSNCAVNDCQKRLLEARIAELLEALEECANHAGGDIGDIDWEMVRTAIKKAKENSQP